MNRTIVPRLSFEMASQNEETVDRKKNFFTSYNVRENQYEPIGESTNHLPSGFYRPMTDSYGTKTFLLKKNVVTPNLYRLPNETQEMILKDIKRFWESEEIYKKFGSVYKRNILLYSQPGNGKTSLINMICETLIKEHDGIVITIENGGDLSAYRNVMDKVRSIEPNRKVIMIIEDFERMAMNETYTSMLLQLLDGSSQFNGVVTFATTNHPELLEKKFTCRPSRFNLIIEYPKPNAEVRRVYMEKKLSDGGIDINDEKVKADIERYVRKSEGYTFDFVKELIQGIYLEGQAEVNVFDTLNKMIKKDGKIKMSDEMPRKTIGFSSASTLSENSVLEEVEVEC